MKVLSVGDAVYDILTPPLEALGRVVTLEDILEVPGGNALNFAMEMAVLGHESTLHSCVGEDERGEALLRWMGENGVKFTGERRGRTCVTLGIQGKEKMFLTYHGCLGHLHPENAPLKGVEHLHIGGLWKISPKSVEALARRAKEMGIEVSVDISNPPTNGDRDFVFRLLHHVDILFLSEWEMNWLLNGKPFEKLFSYLGRGMRYILLHKGEEGGVLFSTEGYADIHVPRVVPRIPTGAGDVTNAAFVHALHAGRDPQEAAHFAFCAGTIRASGVLYPKEREITTFMEMNKI